MAANPGVRPASNALPERETSLLRYLNTHDSLNRIWPWIDAASVYDPGMNIPDFNFYYEADARHNPTRAVVWTDAYVDRAGKGWLVSAIAPDYRGDFLERWSVPTSRSTASSTTSSLADELDRTKSRFLATAAHELRTPIAVNTGYAEYLQSSDPPPYQRGEILATMRVTSTRLESASTRAFPPSTATSARRRRSWTPTSSVRRLATSSRMPASTRPPASRSRSAWSVAPGNRRVRRGPRRGHG